MASPILFLFLSTLLTATAQQRTSNMSLGSSLSPTSNSSLLSPSGLFAFGFYPKGNGFAIGIWFAATPQQTVTWTANRDDPPIPSNDTLVLTSDGRLILQQSQGQQVSIANQSESAYFASLLDSGNFVLYNSDSKIIWQSFDVPTDTLLPDQLLKAGNQLVSSASETDHSTGSFRLVMQTDGNVVLYPVGSLNAPDYAYWGATSNFVGENATLTLDENGRLYILNSTGLNAHNITNGGTPSDGKRYRATIDADGIFRIYFHDLDQSGNWSIEWSDPTDKCIPKGICDINGYCVLVNEEPVCSCPPGFVFINQEKKNLGCIQNFTAESCVFRNENLNYVIQELEYTVWEDSRYYVSSSMTKEECNQACLEDCNCEAAQFQDGECSKQKLPLRFGRLQQNKSSTTFIKVGNGGLLDGNNTSTMVLKKGKNELQMGILITGIACLVSALIVLAISGVLIFRHRNGPYKEISNANEGLVEDVTLRSFTYKELERATNNFKEKLGRGAFGTVFKGTLSNGQRAVAVKRLEKVVDEGEVEFRNEMRSIGRTHHRNLVRLLGYCHDGSNRLLVYEYMRNGSLANFLFKSEVKPNWSERTGIALNVARGILYLHEECETQIIHCDINPNNILMDEYRCAKIADFGLAKLLMPDQTRTFTGIRGTRGYVAPEWHKNLPITAKADVYSFGIVFLEIICCRKSVDSNVPEDEAVLAEWVYKCFEANELNKLVLEDVEAQILERMISIGLWCIQEEPSDRPPMKKVVLMLEGTVEIPVPPSPTSFSIVST